MLHPLSQDYWIFHSRTRLRLLHLDQVCKYMFRQDSDQLFLEQDHLLAFHWRLMVNPVDHCHWSIHCHLLEILRSLWRYRWSHLGLPLRWWSLLSRYHILLVNHCHIVNKWSYHYQSNFRSVRIRMFHPCSASMYHLLGHLLLWTPMDRCYLYRNHCHLRRYWLAYWLLSILHHQPLLVGCYLVDLAQCRPWLLLHRKALERHHHILGKWSCLLLWSLD